MKATKEEMNWLLNDTLEYYSKNTNRRCVDAQTLSCFYDPHTLGKGNISNGCAIGRWMTQEQKAAADSSGAMIPVGELGILLPNILRKYPMWFLEEIQRLHDTHTYWNTFGLTQKGLEYVNKLQLKIAAQVT